MVYINGAWIFYGSTTQMVKFLKHQVRAINPGNIEQCPSQVQLEVVQQPVKARVSGRKETRNLSRRLVDPQPIVQLKLEHEGRDVVDYSLGVYFIRASIECCGFNDSETFLAKQRKSKLEECNEPLEVLRGTTTVTAQFYKGSPYLACGVFDNLSVRFKGDYRLRFDLYEIQSFGTTPKIIHWDNATVYSSRFTVYTDASFDGLEASPVLNEQLKKAGCRIRTRKPKSGPLGDYKISKTLAYPTLPNSFGYQGSPQQYGYFSLPVPSRVGTPLRRTEAVYSRAGTPMNGFMGTPGTQYFTPVQNVLDTPQSRNTESFLTPMTHIPMANPYSEGLDLSPLETEAIFSETNNSGYVLDNENAFKLDFENLDSIYPISDVPRSQDKLLESIDVKQETKSQNVDFMSMLQNDQMGSQENPFAVNDMDFSF